MLKVYVDTKLRFDRPPGDVLGQMIAQELDDELLAKAKALRIDAPGQDGQVSEPHQGLGEDAQDRLPINH